MMCVFVCLVQDTVARANSPHECVSDVCAPRFFACLCATSRPRRLQSADDAREYARGAFGADGGSTICIYSYIAQE